MRRTFLVTALSGALLAGSALAQDAPQTGGTLVVALNADIRSLEPGINRDANTDSVIHQMFEGLVAYKADLDVGPALAESWTVSDDGTEYRFTLRDGVKFHNGAPLTSAEFKWSWDRQFENSSWPCQRFFNGSGGLKVVAVEAPDPRTVVFRLEEPNVLFLKQLANFQCAIVAAHPESVDAEGKWATPIGTGPFKFKEWKPAELVQLERFADYQSSSAPTSGLSGERKAYVDQVQFRIIPDASAAEAALLTGVVDIIPDVDVDRIGSLKEKGVTVLTSPGLGWSTFLIQTQDPVFSDPRMRLALAHAIDIDALAEVRTGGLSIGNPSAVSESTSFFDDSFLEWPAYDPAKAAALLKEAGYNGHPVKIQTNTRYTGMYENAVLIQAMLAAAGLNAELEVLDWATQLDNYLKGDFQLQSFSYSARFDPGLLYATFVGDKEKTAWSQWDDAEARALLAESSKVDDATRKELFEQIHARMAQQVPIIPIYFDPVIEAVHPNVQGYSSWAAAKPITWGVWKKN